MTKLPGHGFRRLVVRLFSVIPSLPPPDTTLQGLVGRVFEALPGGNSMKCEQPQCRSQE